jgi:hypothetical protein
MLGYALLMNLMLCDSVIDDHDSLTLTSLSL